MKRLLVIAITFLSLFGAATASAQVRIRLATLAPKGSSYHQLLQGMGEKWRQAPGGGVALTIYTDGTMGSEPDIVRRMRAGQVQAAMLTAAGVAEIDPAAAALQKMPMMFHSLDEATYVREKLQPTLEKKLYDKGFVVLFWGDAGWVYFFTKDPVIHPADLNGRKIFVAAGDTGQVDILRAAGWEPVPLEYTDTLTGLQTGLIDAVPTLPFYALAGQFYGVTKHMLALNWVPLVGATVVTRKAWEALPEATRAALLASARETGAAIQARSRAEGEEAVTAMQKRGLQVHTVTPELEAEWRRAAEVYYPKVRGNLVPADMFDAVRDLVREYRAAKGDRTSSAKAVR